MMRVFTVHAPQAGGGATTGAPDHGRPHDFRLREWRAAGMPPADVAPEGPGAVEPGTMPIAARPDATRVETGPDRAAAVATASEVPEKVVEPTAVTPGGAAAPPWAAGPPRGSVPVLNAAPQPWPGVEASDAAGADALSPASLRELRLVPEGFSFWAFVFGPFWFLFRGLWLAALLWMVLAAVLIGLFSAVPALAPSTPWATLVLFLLTGFHARDAERWTLHHRGLRESGVVLGLDEEDALLRLGLRAGGWSPPASRAEEIRA